ncbi:heavy-metal-associated domain-containing protein [Alienimonas californiensis]|uniref:Heavy-metal-associated domain protein n=1 Tax=Alienimonas californiensis TaxID=2527989 RepID=A0A517PDN2_9PLAN|nr:heavy-metal-associated domain-containing protein [Alienimonas californiensis]QDT17480.1 Heavy-metal-associated domain protein [Alienimonas californiensis]
MKRLIPFAALLCLPLALVGCAPEDGAVDPVAPVAPVDGDVDVESGSAVESGSSAALGSDATAILASYEGPVTFTVPDMNCPISCAPAVQNTLAELEGVSDVQTDVPTNTVKFNVGKGFNLEAAKKALAAKNFPVENVMI